MKRLVRVTCPYCDTSYNTILVEGYNVECCDLEQGGCDEHFVVKVEIKVLTRIFFMREVKEE